MNVSKINEDMHPITIKLADLDPTVIPIRITTITKSKVTMSVMETNMSHVDCVICSPSNLDRTVDLKSSFSKKLSKNPSINSFNNRSSFCMNVISGADKSCTILEANRRELCKCRVRLK